MPGVEIATEIDVYTREVDDMADLNYIYGCYGYHVKNCIKRRKYGFYF